MEPVQLIVRKVTSDRGKGVLTTHDVLVCIKSMKGESFTTRDLADKLEAKHCDTGRSRLEYSVRASVTWLVDRGVVVLVGETMRASPRCLYPYRVTMYRARPECEPADFAALYKAFGLTA